MVSTLHRIALSTAALATAFCAVPAAHAEAMQVTITGTIPHLVSNNYFAYAGQQIGFQSVAEADSFLGSLRGTAFSLTLNYDTDAVGSGSPLRFNEGVTLVGGSLGGVTDFSGWDPSISLSSTDGASRIVLEGWKMVYDFPDPLRPGRDQYIYFSINALFSDPAAIDPSLNQLPQHEYVLTDFASVRGEFGYRGGDAGSQEYAFWVSSNFSGMHFEAIGAPVPEPGAWAMLGAGLAVVCAARRCRA